MPRGVRKLFRLADLRRDAAADVDEEVRYHLERLVDDLLAEGLSRTEAEAEARHRFGDVDAYRRALERIDGRREKTMTRIELLDTVWRTWTHALRGLARAPGFTLSVVSILALGLGANAVMFGVVDRLLLSPPAHVRDAGTVRHVYARRHLADGSEFVGRSFTYPDYTDLLSVPAFRSVAAWSGPGEETLGRGEGARPVRLVAASASLVPLLGAEPVIGRAFTVEDAVPGAAGAAWVSHEMWERAFDRDPDVLGRVLDLSSGSYTVVGVAPPGFTGAGLRPVDVWVPLELHQVRVTGTTAWQEHRNWWWLRVVARLADGVSSDAAAAQATAAHRRGREDMIGRGDYDATAALLASPIVAAQDPDPSAESRVARWLAAVSAIVLLIACFNVANLLMARAAERRHEVAVRLALGVSRVRLVAELLVQSLALSTAGALGALALAQAAGRTIHRVLLPDLAMTSPASSGRLLVLLGVGAVLTALLAGVAPALQATRSDLAGSLRGEVGRARSSSRGRTGLLVAQAALSVVLLVGAGLFVKSLRQARGLDLGFDARHVVVAELQWNETLPSDERTTIYRQSLERVRRIPGVRAAGLTYTVPFASAFSIGTPRVPGLDSVPTHPNGGPYANKVSSGYFEAMGLEILRGRSFEPEDDAPGAAPVAVVAQSMARAYWPSGDAVGSCLLLGDEENPPCTEVVGIVEDHRREELVEDDAEWLYFLNQAQPAYRGPPQAVMLGTDVEASRMVGAVQAELRATSPQIRFASAQSLQDNIEPQLRSWTLGASLFSAFGVLALVVAVWGLYSVLAFEVATRRRELGIRCALGAGVPRLLRLVLSRAVSVAAVGVALGLAVAILAARAVGPLLFAVSPWDSTVYASVGATLLAAAVGAGLLPAWRATRADPREALQAE
jgi:predicted permease